MSSRQLTGDARFSGEVQSDEGYGRIKSEIEREWSSSASMLSWQYTFDKNVAKDWAWFRVCWSDLFGLFVAVASARPSGSDTTIATSPDGLTWTKLTAPASIRYRGVASHPWRKAVCAVSSDSNSNNIAYSVDGVNWFSRTANTSGTGGLRAICASPGRFLAVGYACVFESFDGSSWISKGVSSYDFNSVCWSQELNMYCGVGAGGEILTCTDPRYWSLRHNASHTLNDVTYSPKHGFVAVGNNGRVSVSKDGVTWTTSQPSAMSGSPQLMGICYSPEMDIFLAVSSVFGQNNVFRSYDGGVTWYGTFASEYGAMGSNVDPLFGACWSPALGRFCIVSGDDYRASAITSPQINFAAAIARGLV